MKTLVENEKKTQQFSLFINSLNNLILFIIVASIYALIRNGSCTTGLLIAQRTWKCLTVVSGEGLFKLTLISAALSGNVLVGFHFFHGNQFLIRGRLLFLWTNHLIKPKLLLSFLHLIYDFGSQYITFRIASCQT